MDTQVLPKPGQRVECVAMDQDPHPIAPGSRGTVLATQWCVFEHIITVAWDSGRSLNLLSSCDEWKILTAEEM